MRSIKLTYAIILFCINSDVLPIASVQKDLLVSLLHYATSQSVTLTASDLETAVVDASTMRESVDTNQYLLVHHLLRYARSSSISLTASGLGDAVIAGALSVQKEVMTLLLYHAKKNSISISSSDIESALTQAAKDWIPLTQAQREDPDYAEALAEWEALAVDQSSVVHALLQYAQEQSITLSAAGIEAALEQAAISDSVNVVRLLLSFVEQTGITLTASGLETVLSQLVADLNEFSTTQKQSLNYILTHVIKKGIVLTSSNLGAIVIACATKYTS